MRHNRCMMRATFLLFCLPLWSCTQFPELDAAQDPAVARAPYPDFLPIEVLTADTPTRIVPGEAAQVLERADRLQSRTAGSGASAGTDVDRDRLARLRSRAAASGTTTGAEIDAERLALLRRRAEALRAR